MSKLIKAFRGVRNGEIYPTEFEPGEECPPELEDGARALGALEDAGPPRLVSDADSSADSSTSDDDSGAADGDDALGADSGDVPNKAELIGRLEAANISFDKRWGVDKLQAALDGGKKD